MVKTVDVILGREWDILIVLDACRYDVFKVLFGKTFKVEKAVTEGTCTIEWFYKTFTVNNADMKDVIYISGSPYIGRHTIRHDNMEYNPLRHFANVVEVWKYAFMKIGYAYTVNPFHVMKQLFIQNRLHRDKKFEEVRYNYRIWVPAVSSKYIYGHFHPEKCKSDLPNFMKSVDLSGKKIDSDPKRYLNKDFIYVIETPMVEKGMEEESRLAAPSDIIKLCKNIDTPFVKAVIDFEHTLGAGIDIENEINKLSNKDGEYIKVLHVGFPTPLQPGHIPIPMGSEQQEWLYEWMYKLRKKGFDSKEDRYIIFERAGGDDPIQQSVLALRKIIEFLEKDIPPEKLPPEFYGITESNLKMQEVEIREHAFDPIKNLFVLPEESHTFLSRNAIEKGKGKEWGAEKYR